MILSKEFYFVRHGQTDHNILEGVHKGDHPGDIPLNETGRRQAQNIAPLIASLPIQTVCSSPTTRTQETKEIITAELQANHYVIDDLSECSMMIWKEMAKLGMYSLPPSEGVVRFFMDRVQNGINRALSLPGLPLIVAHGGIHWAACCLMGIEKYEWVIDNCAIIRFSIGDHGRWIAVRIA